MAKTALIFSGQGAQAVGMGQLLYERYGEVRRLYDEANEILGWDLKTVSFEGPEHDLTETKVCQPALFVHGMAVIAVLSERGNLGEPAAALGLSLGEVTALAAAGVFTFGTGLRVVAERGRLMQEACASTRGAMASVIGVSREEVAKLCGEHDIDLANLNCPGQIVVSGEEGKVQAALEAARERGFKRVIPLKVAGAYHSRLMEPARERFAEFLLKVPFHPPRFPVFSNTTAQQVRGPDEIREALVRQVVSPVLWEDCMRNAAALGVSRFLECGPGKILAGLARRTDPAWEVVSLAQADDIENFGV